MYLLSLSAFAGAEPSQAPPVPTDSDQLVLAIVPGQDDSHATVTRWRRSESGWVAEGRPVPARIGPSGVAWGRGLHPPQPGLQKREGDNRAPEGVFALGSAYGDAPVLPQAVRWPYHPVGPRDLWYEDPQSPLYNSHVVVPGDAPLTPEQQKATMRRGDPAHALKVFVAHNASPGAIPGAGSAIFLHTWRKGGAAPTAGCTAMARENLDELVTWLDPVAKPVFALLSAQDAERLALSWDLPAGQHCFSWIHGPDHATDCHPTPAACEEARTAMGREATVCAPAARVACTELSSASDAGSRCFGDMGSCERYRAHVGSNGLSSSACSLR